MFNTIITVLSIIIAQPAGYPVYDDACDSYGDEWEEGSCECECPCRNADIQPQAQVRRPVPPRKSVDSLSIPQDLRVTESPSSVAPDTALLTLDTAKALPRDVMVLGTNFYIIPTFRAGLGSGFEAGVTMLGIYPLFSVKKEIISTDHLVISGAGATLLSDELGLVFGGIKSQFESGPLSLYGDVYVAVAMADGGSDAGVTLTRFGAKLRLSEHVSMLGEAWPVPVTDADERGMFTFFGLRFNWNRAARPHYIDVFMMSFVGDDYSETFPLLMMNYGVVL